MDKRVSGNAAIKTISEFQAGMHCEYSIIAAKNAPEMWTARATSRPVVDVR
jgi:hypothetical protein